VKQPHRRSSWPRLLGIVVIAACGFRAHAQENPDPQSQAGAPARTAPPSEIDYLLRDVGANALDHDAERYTLRPVIAILADYTFFTQDDASVAQVGEQEDTRDLRAGRLGLLVRGKGDQAWEGYVAADFQEKRTREDAVFQLYDLRFGIPVGSVNLDIGKQKQPFVYEMVGLSLLNPQQERILSPFFVTRSIGVQASGQAAGDRMTWAAGWFNDWLESGATFSDNANDYVARITGLAKASPDNLDYVHVGLGLRRVGPDAGLIRMSGRPESNVADKYLDTGEFAADYVGEIALEAVWDRGPIALIAEHVESRAHAPASGNPRFSGSYLMLSWMISGDSRRYNRAVGYATPIAPQHRQGAFELVARYSHVDLKDGTIDGGVLDKWHLGLNWWASRQWKAGVSYGDADLDKGGTRGSTEMLLFRVQWFY
jgi:phosphate-selective porin OprO/OprP